MKRVYWEVENLSKQLHYLPVTAGYPCIGIVMKLEELRWSTDNLDRYSAILRQA